MSRAIGCPKAGLGKARLALHVENLAFRALVVGTLALACAIVAGGRGPTSERVPLAVGAASLVAASLRVTRFVMGR